MNRLMTGITGTVLAVGASVAVAACGGSSNATSTDTVVAQVVAVTVTSPPNGAVINATSVAVRGTVIPPGATVTVDGQPAAVGNGVFTANANLQVGKTTIDVIGSAPGRSPGSTTIAITRPGANKPKSHRSSSSSTSSSGATPGVANEQPSPGSSSNETPCPSGGGLSVGPDTTCEFAQNVESTYESQGPGTYFVYSPVTQKTYSMTCQPQGAEIVCTGGNNASVFFPG